MLSVNQMSVYHTASAYNITNKNASDQLQKKLNLHENTQRGVQQIMKCMCQKTPQKSVQVSPILDQNYTI